MSQASLRFIDFKEQARTHKQAAQRSALCTTERKRRFYMDYGFMHASTSDTLDHRRAELGLSGLTMALLPTS